MKMSKTLVIIAVVVIVTLLALWWRSRSTKADVLVTPMPLSGYSLEESLTGSDGFPAALPESLPPIPSVPMTNNAEVITMDPTMPAMGATTTMPATLPAVQQESAPAAEGFMAYAPKNFRGDIL